MIPSDHFVRFYNEVFKFLEAAGPEALEDYYRTVSRNQERHCLELFRSKGLAGMHQYWEHIRIEENCDLTLELDADCFHLSMHACPSLAKIIDNDAGPCPGYCDHCPGWILPLMSKAGFYAVYDLVDRTAPRCEMYVFSDEKKALTRRSGLAQNRAPELLRSNF